VVVGARTLEVHVDAGLEAPEDIGVRIPVDQSEAVLAELRLELVEADGVLLVNSGLPLPGGWGLSTGGGW
jgi:hypothetical protein